MKKFLRLLLSCLLGMAYALTAPLSSTPTPAPVTQASATPLPSPGGRGDGGEGVASPTPSPIPLLPLGEEQIGEGIISFIINVHDWTHPAESTAILLQLVDLFERFSVRGDFYFTAEITRELAENHPEVIERLKTSNMTISYHVRPPHPLYNGFDARLKGLDDATLYQTLLDYETYALDLTTGDLDRSRPGGYTYVAQIFGRNPVVAPTPNNDWSIKDTAQRVYASLGAQMTLIYHEEGTKLEQPFETVNGLLVRPSDFSVTRTTTVDGTDNFWWNKMSAPNAADYNPTRMLKNLLADWQRRTGNSPYRRLPFITVLIHENNFYRRGAEGWSSIYFEMKGAKRGNPLPAPWNLSAPDPSTPRSRPGCHLGSLRRTGLLRCREPDGCYIGRYCVICERANAVKHFSNFLLLIAFSLACSLTGTMPPNSLCGKGAGGEGVFGVIAVREKSWRDFPFFEINLYSIYKNT